MIYIDTERTIFFRGAWRRHVHCTADSLVELHGTMSEWGIPPRAFHDKPGLPHYDLFDQGIDIAHEKGALQVVRREFIRLARLCR
jgi:hypothetical protein